MSFCGDYIPSDVSFFESKGYTVDFMLEAGDWIAPPPSKELYSARDWSKRIPFWMIKGNHDKHRSADHQNF